MKDDRAHSKFLSEKNGASCVASSPDPPTFNSIYLHLKHRSLKIDGWAILFGFNIILKQITELFTSLTVRETKKPSVSPLRLANW